MITDENEGNYVDYIYICEDCGSIEWKEISDKSIKICLNQDGETKKIGEEWEDSDTYYYCNECRSDSVKRFEYEELGEAEEEIEKKIKEIANMTNQERLDWLTKYRTIQKLK